MQIKKFPLRKIRNRQSLILHITGNLDRYNGAGQQAITLAKNMDFCTSVMAFFSGGSEFSAGEMDSLQFLRVPGQSEIHKYFYAFVTLLCLRPRVLHIHGFAIGREFIPLAKLLGIKIVLKSTLMGVDDLKSISESRRMNKSGSKLLIIGPYGKNVLRLSQKNISVKYNFLVSLLMTRF